MPVPPLAPGATGDMVRALQYALIANGYSVGGAGANGTFGEETTSALQAFRAIARCRCACSATRRRGRAWPCLAQSRSCVGTVVARATSNRRAA
jgi:hypothetical protein